MVRTELNVNGFSTVDNAPVAVSRETSDTDVLPDLTVKALLTKDLVARFNGGKASQLEGVELNYRQCYDFLAG